MYIVKMFEIAFPFNVKDNTLFHGYIILDFPITYRNASVLCQSECACLHKTVNMVVFFVKSNDNTYNVPITRRRNQPHISFKTYT